MTTIEPKPSAVLVLSLALAYSAVSAPASGAVVLHSGYLGGSSWEFVRTIAADDNGSAYVGFWSDPAETDFPVAVGPDLSRNGGSDVGVARVRADATGLEWAGFLGGAGDEGVHSIALDPAGNAYVTGWTKSAETTFPVLVGPDLQRADTGAADDGFVARIKADGTALIYAGYIGGLNGDQGNGIAVDASGAAYVSGLTNADATTFPVAVGPDLTYGGGGDGWVAKVRPDGTGFAYAGFIGGSFFDSANECAVDGSGNLHVTGNTMSTASTFPVQIGPDLVHNGDTDAFVAKVRADASGLEYAGYIGGGERDLGGFIGLDGAGNAYVAGDTASSEATFPVAVGPDLTYGGGTSTLPDGYVVKLRRDGSGLEFAGYVGGTDNDFVWGLAVDADGTSYLGGETSSTEASFPIAVGPDLTANGKADGFITAVKNDGTGLVYSSFIGGSEDDRVWDVASGPPGTVHLAGQAASSEATFPVLVGPDLSYNGGLEDAFVLALGDDACPTSALPVEELKAVRSPASRDDVELTWAPDAAARGYNVWYVVDKEDIPDARQSTSPPAVPVAGCAVPAPASGPACTDAGAVARTIGVFHYQVRVHCGATSEGP